MGCSNSPEGAPGAENRTEILSPANEQYKGRRSLRAVQALKRDSRGPMGCSNRPEGVPLALRAFQGRRAVPGARRVVGEILYEVGLFGEIGAVPEDGGAGFVNLIFGAARVGAILEGEARAERQFERLTKEAVNLDILK